MELLDVLDEEGNMTGKVEDKDVIHEKALWHKEVEAWIVNEQGEILIQKRAATKKQVVETKKLDIQSEQIKKLYQYIEKFNYQKEQLVYQEKEVTNETITNQ